MRDDGFWHDAVRRNEPWAVHIAHEIERDVFAKQREAERQRAERIAAIVLLFSVLGLAGLLFTLVALLLNGVV